jgi:hypothetical protein
MRIRKQKSTTIAATVAAVLMTGMTGAGAGATERQSSPPAQTPPVPGPAAAAPAANPADVGSVDAILQAAYDTISGPAGQQRDWNRFRSLFVSGARLIPVVPNPEGGFRTVQFSAEEYVEHGDPYFQKNGFFEHEVARRTERYGSMAQVFSTYESRHGAADPKPFERGINSFQLMNDGHRWWIVTIFWQGETSGNPIPKEYLQGVN